MKNLFLTLILICSFILKSSSQVEFFGGTKAGICGSQVSGDYLAGFKKAGLYAGFLAGVSLNKEMSLHMELQFVQKGSRKNARPDIGDYRTYLLRLSYLEIPIIFTYQGNSYFELEGGLSYGYLVKNTDVEFDENGVMPGKNPFRKFEISGHLGMNYLVSDNLKVNFRLNNSLTHVREHAGGGTYLLNTGQFNTVLMLGLVYKMKR